MGRRSAVMKRLVKPVAVAVMGSTVGLQARLSWLARAGQLTVLNLHRVDDSAASEYEAMNPAVFDDLISWLRKAFTLTTFGRLAAVAYRDRPPLILSFDDGYKDFIEVVVPILRRYGVTANQNVIPGCMESGRPPYSVMLQDFIRTAPARLLEEVRVPELPQLDAANRALSARRTAVILKSRSMAKQEHVMAELEPYFARFDGFRPTPMMTRSDVREVASAHEVGAHSYEHATMPAETDEYVAADARRCLEYFQDEISCRPAVYAFPNGVARRRQVEIVHRTGFVHVLLTGRAPSDAPPWLHGRRLVYGDSRREMRWRAVGLFEARGWNGKDLQGGSIAR